VVSVDPLALLSRQLREQLRQRVDARGLAGTPRTERRVRVREEALELLRASGAILPQRDLTRMVNEVSDEVVGFGPIEFLLKDPDVTEVMVANGPIRDKEVRPVEIADLGSMDRQKTSVLTAAARAPA
jgi:pilus assembly protein CpaF